ncbi:MAG: class II aldolase [Planctomycetes bacterium]|nr:class II aldolase [Planctomycetota bacterium]
MDKALYDLIEISRLIGRDRSLVVGTGGNTSVKTGDGRSMYIKASGTALADMGPRRGWRRLDVVGVKEIFEDKGLGEMGSIEREVAMIERLQLACDDGLVEGGRPSIESLLHVVLGKTVLHLHALEVLSYVCCKRGRERFEELFAGEEKPPLWVGYVDPGYSLSKKVFREVKRYRKEYGVSPGVMLLQKHGLLIAAGSRTGVMRRLRDVIRRCRGGLKEFEVLQGPTVRTKEVEAIKGTLEAALWRKYGVKQPLHFYTDSTVAAFCEREDAGRLLKVAALTPDEMGFLKQPIVWLTENDLEKQLAKIGSQKEKVEQLPTGFLVKEAGLFIWAQDELAGILKELIEGALFVRSRAEDMGGINPLNERQRYFIDHWEGEKYRVELKKRDKG